ncbi:hypothetical protein D8B29_03420 [Verminephrobacter eiseniae]|nr:hypothetical protein [Verminephrobacter eiseniae]MCW5303537.1 hypothetical protein [Verminephrobacter eiseniae]MCW8178711.1 hypothetical protein [Verminephrobacter eiseniae]MCW8188331.1 hypothetical protein [Verminephrobacter eiseniae]
MFPNFPLMAFGSTIGPLCAANTFPMAARVETVVVSFTRSPALPNDLGSDLRGPALGGCGLLEFWLSRWRRTGRSLIRIGCRYPAAPAPSTTIRDSMQQLSDPWPIGGRKAHRGGTLRQVAAPDVVVTHAPPGHCAVCQSSPGQALPGGRAQAGAPLFDALTHAFPGPTLQPGLG